MGTDKQEEEDDGRVIADNQPIGEGDVVIIHSVSGHCHLVPLSLECLYQFLLLLRCHSCKYGILPADCIIIRLLTDG